MVSGVSAGCDTEPVTEEGDEMCRIEFLTIGETSAFESSNDRNGSLCATQPPRGSA